MNRSAKTVSLRHLHSAVKEAVASTKAIHEDFEKIVVVIEGPVYFHPPIYCGLPPFEYLEQNVERLEAINDSFVDQLSKNPAIQALSQDGEFKAALVLSHGQASLGFVPGSASITE